MILTEKDAYWINVSDDLRFLRDGKRFIWSSERTGYRHLYLYDLEGKQLAQLTHGEWEVTGLVGLDEDAKSVFFTATEKSPLERHLYRVGLDGSGFARVTQDAGTHEINMAAGARAYLDTYSDAGHPPRQDLYRADGTKIATLNENAVPELADFALSPVEFLTVKTHDNVMLNAMMIKPADFDASRKYPVIVYTYGGPHAQVVRNAWGGANFLWHEMMAQKGFLIFAVDNRGSAGRGHLFEEPIHYRLGAQELSDQRDGVRYLRSLPYVDGTRIGIWGSSYGGQMTLHAMFRDAGDFKAGFAGSPVSDWKLYDTIYTERYLGQPAQRVEEYEESSPVKNAAGLQGKLLIAAGTGDDNVHFANTLEVMDELIASGKYAEVAVFPGRGHGISDPPARVVLFRRVTQFFLGEFGRARREVKVAPASPPASYDQKLHQGQSSRADYTPATRDLISSALRSRWRPSPTPALARCRQGRRRYRSPIPFSISRPTILVDRGAIRRSKIHRNAPRRSCISSSVI